MDVRLKELPGGFLTLTCEGNVVEANDTFLNWMQLTKEQVTGMHMEQFLTNTSKMMFYSYFYSTINLYGEVNEFFLHFCNSSGQSSAYLMNAKRLTSNKELIDCLIIPMKKRMDYEVELRNAKRQLEVAYQEKEETLKNLQLLHREIEIKQQELMQVNTELLILSNTDKLTGVANRRLFQHVLEELVSNFETTKEEFSLLLLDIDYFKKVNDTFGHIIGDSVLKKLAVILTNFARLSDCVARYGGEEFILLLPKLSNSDAMEKAMELNKIVEEHEWLETGGLTISIGVATFSNTSTIESLLEQADQALYYSKQTGRNKATHYEDIK